MINKSTLSYGHVLLLCLAVSIYSLSGFFSKSASFYDFFSPYYLLCLFGVVTVLGIYAVLWQIALKKVDLSTAYLFKSTGIVFGLLIAHFAFGESISLQNIAGSALVLCGLLILPVSKY